MYELTVAPEEAGGRIDAYLALKLPELSRSAVARLIKEGQVHIGTLVPKPSYLLQEGDQITVNIPPPKPTEILPEEIPLDVVYEDEDLLVINKAKGMVTHPAPGSREGTLVNAILAHCKGQLSGIGGVERPGIVHRLDKDTTGLIVVAKNDMAHRSLAHQIAQRDAERKYLALVWGNPKFERARVEAPIRRHPVDRQRYVVATTPDGPTPREAVTELKVRERYIDAALLEASLRTGRTHQIRVHCLYIGHPVIGDPVYGRKTPASIRSQRMRDQILTLHGQALHAFYLSFNHPRTGERLEFTAPPPEEFQSLQAALTEHAQNR